MKTKLFTLFLALVASVGTMFAESGTCGDNLTWDLTDGVLTISGSGAMYDYSRDPEDNYTTAPWAHKVFSSIVINNGVTSIGDRAFLSCCCCRQVTVTIPNSVTSIGNSAFGYCPSITSLTIPNSVTSIGEFAFSSCRGLTSIEIPNSVINIGAGAFFQCSSLTSVTIPEGITDIGYDTFSGCSALTTLTCYATNPPAVYCGYECHAFLSVNRSIPVYVPANSIAVYKNAKGWKEFTNIQAIQDESMSINIVTPLPDNFDKSATKLLYNGQILILRDDKTYTLTGQDVR